MTDTTDTTDTATQFDLPVDPDQFSVLLAPSELRKIDFSALEFATARRALIEYIKTYFPNDFNDFVSNNGVIMLVELLAYMTAVLSLRSDMLANEAFLPTATSEDAVINHLALIGQQLGRATPAVVDIECSVVNTVDSDIHIPSGQQFIVAGEGNDFITYELYQSPTNLAGDIVIPAGKHGVIAYGVEGKTESLTVASDGAANQRIIVSGVDAVLEAPIWMSVTNGDISEEWRQIDHIERAEANDKVFEVQFRADGKTVYVLGDNETGAIPPAGAEILIVYRIGGGARGRIGVGIINEQRALTPEYPYTASVGVIFRNVTPSSGGVDKESLEGAKKRAPREFATHDSIVTEFDYTQLVGSYSHPVFGAVAKAVATIRTALNANRVELYVLAEGVDGPMTPNEGLKRAIQSYVGELNVLTDHVVVFDARIRAVDINATVAISRGTDASVIKVKVDQAINDFFDTSNWDLGEALYLSKLYDLLGQIDGIKYVDIFEPTDNILATGKIASSDPGVDIDELITLGNKEIKYYYEVVK